MGKESLSLWLQSPHRVRGGRWSHGFSRLEVRGPLLVPSGQAGDSELGGWLLSLGQAGGLASHTTFHCWLGCLKLMETSIGLSPRNQCVPSLVTPLSLQALCHPPGHPSAPLPGPCLQDPPPSSLQPASNLYQLKDIYYIHLLSTIIIYMT